MDEQSITELHGNGMNIARRVVEAAQTKIDSGDIGDPDELAKGIEWLTKWADIDLTDTETGTLTDLRYSGESPEYSIQSFIDGDATFVGNPDDPRVEDARNWVLESFAALLLGPSGKAPKNYMMYQWIFTPAQSVDRWRIVAEILHPGGKSSHEIREILEARLVAAGLPTETGAS